MAKSFRDLSVWSKAVNLTVLIYQLTASFPKAEMYGLSSQMQRAAVSIASNIAEGSARGSKKDFRQFVKGAKGSACELQTQLVIARRLEYARTEDFDRLDLLSGQVDRMLAGLSNYLTAEIRKSKT